VGTSCFLAATLNATSGYDYHLDGTSTEPMGNGALFFGASYGDVGTHDLFIGSEDMEDSSGDITGGAFYIRGDWNNHLLGAFEILGATALGSFGASVVSLGDYDGDSNYDDLVVGSPGNSQQFGEVYAVVDPFSNMATSLTVSVLSGTNTGEDYGHSLVTVIVNGIEALAVGAPSTQTAVSQPGYVDIVDPDHFTLDAGPSLGNPVLATLTGTDGDGAGTALLSVDLDQIAPGELLVGAPYANSNNGVVYVAGDVGGKSDYDMPGEFLQLTTTIDDSYLGFAFTACDLNGDSVDEIFISAPGKSPTVGGVVYVIDSDNAMLLVAGPNSIDINTVAKGSIMGSANATGEPNHLGMTLHCEHDLDNSGSPDLVLADPYNDVVYVLFGPREISTLVTISSARLNPPHATTFTGGSSGDIGSQITTGFLDEDITADLCFTAPGENSGNGALYCFYGQGF
jgi:hypothetical protein